MMRTLVVGVGSTIRGDDGVGPAVAEAVACACGRGAEWMPFDGSALDLLGAFSGPPRYDRGVVIDCVADGRLREGEVARVLLPQVVAPPDGWLSSHHAGILETFALANHLGEALPPDLRFYGIGVTDATSFNDKLSASLTARLPAIIAEIVADLGAVSSGGIA